MASSKLQTLIRKRAKGHSMNSPQHYHALSLFSGIGGFCESFRLAGFKISAAVENDKYAAENYRLNFPDTPLYEGDVHDFLANTHKAEHSLHYLKGKPVDVVFGGPPCQGYSQIGPRDLGDPRNVLYKQFCRIVRVTQPKFVVIENVPNMFLMNKGQFRKEIFTELRRSGYDNIGWMKLNAANFGVPQERHRIFVVAANSSVFEKPIQDVLEAAAASLIRDRVSVGDAIGDLPKKIASDSGISLPYDSKSIVPSYLKEMRLDQSGSLYTAQHKRAWYLKHDPAIALHNHHTKEIEARRLNLIKLLKPGLKADSLPKSVWNNARPEKWRRFHEKEPAHTLLAQMHRDLSEWIHPRHDRWITVREALRLQSFHDGFVLRTSEWQQLKQVGNAVPPLLGFVPAMSVKLALSMLNGKERPFAAKGQVSLFI